MEVWVLIIMHILNQTSPDLFCVVVKSRNASAQYYVVITVVMSFDSLITATPTDPEPCVPDRLALTVGGQ